MGTTEVVKLLILENHRRNCSMFFGKSNEWGYLLWNSVVANGVGCVMLVANDSGNNTMGV